MSHPVLPPAAVSKARRAAQDSVDSLDIKRRIFPLGEKTHAGHSILAALLAGVVVTLVALAFVWPSATSTTKHVPVVVVGNEAQQKVVEKAAEDNDAGFDVQRVATRAEAEARIRDRTAYAGFVFGGGENKPAKGTNLQGIEVMTASAASPVATQLMGRVATGLGTDLKKEFIEDKQKLGEDAARLAAEAAGQAGAAKSLQGVYQQMAQSVPAEAPQVVALGQKLSQQQAVAKTAADKAKAAKAASDNATEPEFTVTDVVALNDKDPRGSGLAASGMPLAMGGTMGGAVIAYLLRGVRSRLFALACYAGLAGLGFTAVLHSWFGVLQGDFGVEWLASGLAFAATSAVIVGLESLFGQLGGAFGSGLTIFLANPVSGITSPPEYLVGGWGTVGQLFVPGAAGSLLRNLSYFPDAGSGRDWAVLLAWSAFGVLGVLVGGAITELRLRRAQRAA